MVLNVNTVALCRLSQKMSLVVKEKWNCEYNFHVTITTNAFSPQVVCAGLLSPSCNAVCTTLQWDEWEIKGKNKKNGESKMTMFSLIWQQGSWFNENGNMNYMLWPSKATRSQTSWAPMGDYGATALCCGSTCWPVSRFSTLGWFFLPSKRKEKRWKSDEQMVTGKK